MPLIASCCFATTVNYQQLTISAPNFATGNIGGHTISLSFEGDYRIFREGRSQKI
jgi:hypothetical protein